MDVETVFRTAGAVPSVPGEPGDSPRPASSSADGESPFMPSRDAASSRRLGVVQLLAAAVRPIASRVRRFLLAGLQHELAILRVELESQRAAQARLLAEVEANHAALLRDQGHARNLLELTIRNSDQASAQRAVAIQQSLQADIHGSSSRLLPALRADIQHQLALLAHSVSTSAENASAHIAANVASHHAHIDGRLTELVSASRAAVSGALADTVQPFQHELRAQLERVEGYAMAAARRIAISCDDDHVLVRSEVGYILCPSSDHAVLMALIERGELERGTRLLIERILSPGEVFLDVGANLGLHTLAACRRVGDTGRVVAIEPFGVTASLLEQTLWINGCSSVTEVRRVALAAAPGTGQLHLGLTSGHHSLYPLDSENAREGWVEVSVTTLDAVAERLTAVHLVKIDVEGAELEVLAGAGQLLRTHPDVPLIVEYGVAHLSRNGRGPADWHETLAALNLTCRAIDPETGATEPFDFLTNAGSHSVNLLCARPTSPVWRRL